MEAELKAYGKHTCRHPIERGAADPTPADGFPFTMWLGRARKSDCWKCWSKGYNRKARGS